MRERAVVLAELRTVTNNLAQSHRERATALAAYRLAYSRQWSHAVSVEHKSSTEASRWADAGCLMVRDELTKLESEIAALEVEQNFLVIELGLTNGKDAGGETDVPSPG